MSQPPESPEPLDSMRLSGRILFGTLFLPTGLALVIYVVSGVSLLAGVGLTMLGVSGMGALLWRQASPAARERLKRRVRIGAVAALAATIAYDLSRYLFVASTSVTFWPFDIFEVFGRALLGPSAEGAWVSAAGFVFHVANGVGFGIAYTVAVSKPGPASGIVWALFLEALMVGIYPGWLDIRAIQEFMQVSILGHVVYGSTLGWAGRRLSSR